ncbi:MAG: RraA family protein [Thermomicrobiales bacterium]
MAHDATLFDRMARDLYVAVISDMLDGLGLRDQVLQPGIVPIDPAHAPVLVGRAATMVIASQFEVVAQPYTNQIAAIDALQPGDVAVVAVGGRDDIAVWGELFSNAALARGARGMVTDGCHRDTRMIQALGFPVFSRGARPVDISGRGTVVSHGRPVELAGVRVQPGDIVFAEIDGAAIIPAAVADEVVTKAFEKVAKEDGARQDLRNGALLAEVWARYKVL